MKLLSAFFNKPERTVYDYEIEDMKLKVHNAKLKYREQFKKLTISRLERLRNNTWDKDLVDKLIEDIKSLNFD